MTLISHRGNIEGADISLESNPEYINKALAYGFDVEVDVRYVDGSLYLGHDEPQFLTNLEFLDNPKFWLHAKNGESLYFLLNHTKHPNVFWHQTDDFTLTNKGFIWTYPNKQLFKNSICVAPEKDTIVNNCYGICSDYVKMYN